MAEYHGHGIISKTRYYEFRDRLIKKCDKDVAEELLESFKEIFKFDPNISLYTEKAKEAILERRRKLKEQGISTYESSGAKLYYHRKKAEREKEKAAKVT